MNENQIHREIIEEHARNPIGNAKLEVFTHENSFQSEKTGNICHLRFLMREDEILEIGYHLQGSALALASASIMACQIKGLSILDAKSLSNLLIEFIEGEQSISLPEEMEVYETIRRFPARHDCALLPWRTFCKAIE